jgi:hypothetical protein
MSLRELLDLSSDRTLSFEQKRERVYRLIEWAVQAVEISLLAIETMLISVLKERIERYG